MSQISVPQLCKKSDNHQLQMRILNKLNLRCLHGVALTKQLSIALSPFTSTWRRQRRLWREEDTHWKRSNVFRLLPLLLLLKRILPALLGIDGYGKWLHTSLCFVEEHVVLPIQIDLNVLNERCIGSDWVWWTSVWERFTECFIEYYLLFKERVNVMTI